MIRETDLVSYLPPFLQEYEEQNSTLTAEKPEFLLIWDAANRVLNNHFISTADEYGISRFEKILGILPFTEDTLESRRARIQSRWFTSIPYTLKSLLAKLVALCGENNFTVTKQFSVYQIFIETHLELFGQMEELERLLQSMIPCNMVCTLYNEIICSTCGVSYVTGGVCHANDYLICNDFQERLLIQDQKNITTEIIVTDIITTSEKEG